MDRRRPASCDDRAAMDISPRNRPKDRFEPDDHFTAEVRNVYVGDIEVRKMNISGYIF